MGHVDIIRIIAGVLAFVVLAVLVQRRRRVSK